MVSLVSACVISFAHDVNAIPDTDLKNFVWELGKEGYFSSVQYPARVAEPLTVSSSN